MAFYHLNKEFKWAPKSYLDSIKVEDKKVFDNLFNSDSFINRLFDMEGISEYFLFDNDKNHNIFHYTSFSGLKGISKSKSLYINSINEMNDKNEMIYTKNICKEVIRELTNNENTIEYFEYDLNKIPKDIYVLSLSENDHSQALSSYGDVSICFNTNALFSTIAQSGAHGKENLDQFEDGDYYCMPLKVNYDKSFQRKCIEEVVKVWLASYNSQNEYTLEYFSYLFQQCHATLLMLSLVFKNELLYQEEEIRYILFNRHSGNEIQSETIFNNKHAMKVDFNSNVIEKVIYSHKIENKKDEIRQTLDENGFNNTEVEITKLPY